MQKYLLAATMAAMTAMTVPFFAAHANVVCPRGMNPAGCRLYQLQILQSEALRNRERQQPYYYGQQYYGQQNMAPAQRERVTRTQTTHHEWHREVVRHEAHQGAPDPGRNADNVPPNWQRR